MPPLAYLLVLTMALNFLGLSVPIAAQLVFNRILPVPGASTLYLIVTGVIAIAAIEACLRFFRSLVLLEERRLFIGNTTASLLSRIVRSDFETGERGAARSLDYFQRIAQVADKHTGQSLVAVAELLFLPIIIALMIYIAPMAGVIVIVILAVGTTFTVRDAYRLQKCAIVLNKRTERRYRFLLMVLGAIHPLKALAMEQPVLRAYEAIQSDIARTSLAASLASARMMNGMILTNQVVVAACLIYGAFAVNQGQITLGAVSAIVLLGGRLAAPIQRAVFIFIQSRDLCQAERTLEQACLLEPRRKAADAVTFRNLGKIQATGLGFSAEGGSREEAYSNIELDVMPGETIGLSAGNPEALTTLFRILAGIEAPSTGRVLLNDVDIDHYRQEDLNTAVAYVSGAAPMFYGSIRDNITRMGTVPVEDAMAVAEILGIDGIIRELPQGVGTRVTGMADDSIPASLRQQISMLRALVLRPKLLLLDNVDRGLDRESYARFQTFLGKIEGQATIILASEDLNLTANCQKRMTLTAKGLVRDTSTGAERLVPYRSLKL